MENELTDEQRYTISYQIEQFSNQMCMMLGVDPRNDMMLGFRVSKCLDEWVEDCKRAGVLKDE